MTRVGLVAAIIIIVAASIFFGFRKAAREHAEPSPLERDRPLRQIDPDSRKLLLADIEKGLTTQPLAREYVSTSLQALRARVAKCGKANVTLEIIGAPDVGGLVTKCEGSPCICEIAATVEFVAPMQGGRSTVSEPF